MFAVYITNKGLTSIFLKFMQIIKKKIDNKFKNGPKPMDTLQETILKSSMSLLTEEIENKMTRYCNTPDSSLP